MDTVTLLSLIDNIDAVTEYAEFDVMTSLANVYIKEATLIQEGFKDFIADTDAPITGKDGESLLKKICMFIPRLIAKIIRMLGRILTQFSRKQQRDTDSEYLKKELRSSRFNNYKSAEDFLKTKGIQTGVAYPSGLAFEVTSDPDNANYYIISISLIDVRCYESEQSGSFFTEPDFEKWVDELSSVASTLASNMTLIHQYLESPMKSGVNRINTNIKNTYDKMKDIDDHIIHRMSLKLDEIWRFVNPNGGITMRLGAIMDYMKSVRSMGGSHFFIALSARQGGLTRDNAFVNTMDKEHDDDMKKQAALQKKMADSGLEFDIETLSNTMLNLARHVGMLSVMVEKVRVAADDVKKAMKQDTMKEIKRDVLNA